MNERSSQRNVGWPSSADSTDVGDVQIFVYETVVMITPPSPDYDECRDIMLDIDDLNALIAELVWARDRLEDRQ